MWVHRHKMTATLGSLKSTREGNRGAECLRSTVLKLKNHTKYTLYCRQQLLCTSETLTTLRPHVNRHDTYRTGVGLPGFVQQPRPPLTPWKNSPPSSEPCVVKPPRSLRFSSLSLAPDRVPRQADHARGELAEHFSRRQAGKDRRRVGG